MAAQAEKPRVICIGAGPAGLTAAYRLTAEGLPVTVLERDPELVGGISRTERYKGFRFDVGGHRFFFQVKRNRVLVGGDSWRPVANPATEITYFVCWQVV